MFRKSARRVYRHAIDADEPRETTYVLYYVPKLGEQAVKYDCTEIRSASMARKKRRIICGYGTEVAIHAGKDHPDPLPFGETLWREPLYETNARGKVR